MYSIWQLYVGIVMTNLKAVEYFQHALESANTNLGMTFVYNLSHT